MRPRVPVYFSHKYLGFGFYWVIINSLGCRRISALLKRYPLRSSGGVFDPTAAHVRIRDPISRFWPRGNTPPCSAYTLMCIRGDRSADRPGCLVYNGQRTACWSWILPLLSSDKTYVLQAAYRGKTKVPCFSLFPSSFFSLRVIRRVFGNISWPWAFGTENIVFYRKIYSMKSDGYRLKENGVHVGISLFCNVFRN